MVTASSISIMSPQFRSHLGGDVEKLMGVVCFSRAFSSGGDLRIVVELHRRFILLLRHRDGCGLLDPFGDFPFTTNNVRPAKEKRQRRRAVDTVWRLKTKGISMVSS